MLHARQRFHGHGSLKYLFKNGGMARSHYFTLKYHPNPRRKDSRYAVIVSKKIHKSAVGRNRIRRRVYELLRNEHPELSGVNDIAVIVTSGEVLAADSSKLRASLRDLLKQAQLI